MNDESKVFTATDLQLSRSSFKYSPTVSGTCLAGRLIPAWCFEILPGDSIKMDLHALFKMSTPVYPTMDKLYADVSFFFVPNRLTLGTRYGNPSLNENNNTWSAFIGAQTNLVNMPLPSSGMKLPVFTVGDQYSYDEIPHCLASYFGVLSDEISDMFYVNCLPFLGYFAIWNENYREPNTLNPVTWSITNGDVSVSGYVPVLIPFTSDSYRYVNALGRSPSSNLATVTNVDDIDPFPTSVFHGYFGSLLPWPQRNAEGVTLPLGDNAPVVTLSEEHTNIGDYAFAVRYLAGTKPANSIGSFSLSGRASGNLALDGASNLSSNTSSNGVSTQGLVPTNLYADLTAATAANVNSLRMAIKQQEWYERLARSGNRYDELEYGLFGVRPHDSGDDRPLYLGGKRIELNVEMVASTNGGTGDSTAAGSGSLGALGAFSHTNDSDHYFYHSFDDWGYLYCVFTIRHRTTFRNVVDKTFFRSERNDFYWPTFANIGEVAVTRRELGVIGNVEPIGYQEAWEDYRTSHDRVCGLLKDNLSFMTYLTDFESDEDLSTLLNASKQIKSIDKTLAVASTVSGFQFVYQFTFDFTARRCLPAYSIPSLLTQF